MPPTRENRLSREGKRPPERTRPSLLLRVRDPGDQEAWSEFDRKYRGLILRYCALNGLQASDAEDVRQTVLMSLVQGLRSFEYSPLKGRFRDYLGRVVHNAIRQHFRKQHIRTQSKHAWATSVEPGFDLPHDKQWEREWVMHHYRIALEQVKKTSDAQSIRVFERLLEGDSPTQVAASFALERDAVYKIKQRIRERLQRYVRTQIADEQIPFE